MQLVKVLAQGLQLAEVLPSHSMSSGRQGNGATNGKRREQSGGVIPQVKPLLLPPLHRSGCGEFKVGIYSVPHLNMNDHILRDHQLSFRILWTLDMKEKFPQIKLRVNPHVGLTQSHEGQYMQDSRGSQVAKLEAVIPHKRAEEPVRWRAEFLLIECQKGHYVSFHRCGERRILQRMASLELNRRHKPMLHEFLHTAWHNSGRSPILKKEEGKATPLHTAWHVGKEARRE
jgi:hypothetical protein